MQIDSNFYIVVGPSGRPYIRSKRDRSFAFSLGAFLVADWIPETSKARVRLLAENGN